MPVGADRFNIPPFFCHFHEVLNVVPSFLATLEGRKSYSSIKVMEELEHHLIYLSKTANEGNEIADKGKLEFGILEHASPS
ncbi:MAG: hypothetical protein QXW47_10565 [Candidatus Jordarchaeales archaeon]